jgi:hypothetical protein
MAVGIAHHDIQQHFTSVTPDYDVRRLSEAIADEHRQQ